jgi:predicted nucleotidyltransferase
VSDALTPEQVQVLRQICRAWPARQLVLIGAVGLGVHLPMTWRRTGDLDLTVVADAATVAVDLQSLGFERHPKLEQRWRVPGTRVRIDVLPASKAELDSGHMVFAEGGHVMNLAGFDLAFRHTHALSLDIDTSIAVATVPVIAVLKMAAWLDRPDERGRDLEDLGHILADYLAADDMRRWDDPRLAEVPDFEHQPALALGLDIAEIAELTHRQLVESFLEAIDQPDSIAFERIARASSLGADPQRAFRLRLDAFRAGLSMR